NRRVSVAAGQPASVSRSASSTKRPASSTRRPAARRVTAPSASALRSSASTAIQIFGAGDFVFTGFVRAFSAAWLAVALHGCDQLLAQLPVVGEAGPDPRVDVVAPGEQAQRLVDRGHRMHRELPVPDRVD